METSSGWARHPPARVNKQTPDRSKTVILNRRRNEDEHKVSQSNESPEARACTRFLLFVCTLEDAGTMKTLTAAMKQRLLWFVHCTTNVSTTFNSDSPGHAAVRSGLLFLLRTFHTRAGGGRAERRGLCGFCTNKRTGRRRRR